MMDSSTGALPVFSKRHESNNLGRVYSSLAGTAMTLTLVTVSIDTEAQILSVSRLGSEEASRPTLTIGSPAMGQLVGGDGVNCRQKYLTSSYSYCFNGPRSMPNTTNVQELSDLAQRYKNKPGIKNIIDQYLVLQENANVSGEGPQTAYETILDFVASSHRWENIPVQDTGEATRVLGTLSSEWYMNIE